MTEHLINGKMPRTKKQLIAIREKTRAKILESAMKLFAEKGYHGTSINDIANAADVSKGLAYNYFKSKQNILESIFETLIDMGEDIVEDMHTTADPYEQIKKLIISSFDNAVRHEEYWRLYLGMVFQPDVAKVANKYTVEFADKLLKDIEKLLRKVGIKNARTEAILLGAVFDGVFINYLFDKENFPLEKTKKLLLKKFSKVHLQKLK